VGFRGAGRRNTMISSMRLSNSGRDTSREAGVRCVGAAVFDHTRRVISAVSVSQLLADAAGRAPDELGPQVAATGRAVSRLLGAPE
jgi:IclR family transcriptional regulator, acetate operon repressor